MATKKLGGQEIIIDEDGFIQEPAKWTKEVAEDRAKEEATAHPMTEPHWQLVNYIRDYYLQFDVAPPVRMICKKLNIDLKTIYDLFPKGPAAGTCKVAGL